MRPPTEKQLAGAGTTNDWLLTARTPDERAAYIVGFEAGWKYMLSCCGGKAPTPEAKAWCVEVTEMLRRLEER